MDGIWGETNGGTPEHIELTSCEHDPTNESAESEQEMEGQRNEDMPETLRSGLPCYEVAESRKSMAEGGLKESINNLGAWGLLTVLGLGCFVGFGFRQMLPFEMAVDEARDIAALRADRDTDKRELNEHLDRVESSLNKTADAQNATAKAVDALTARLQYALPLSSNQQPYTPPLRR